MEFYESSIGLAVLYNTADGLRASSRAYHVLLGLVEIVDKVITEVEVRLNE